MIDNTKEYIGISAMWYDDGLQHPFQNIYGIKSGFVVGCFRHSTNPFPTNFQYQSKGNEIPYPTKNECKIHSGFITSLGRYVDRKEGAKIAIACGQIDKLNYSSDTLYSEDVFPVQAIRGENNK